MSPIAVAPSRCRWSAASPMSTLPAARFQEDDWSGRGDSNPRPRAWELAENSRRIQFAVSRRSLVETPRPTINRLVSEKVQRGEVTENREILLRTSDFARTSSEKTLLALEYASFRLDRPPSKTTRYAKLSTQQISPRCSATPSRRSA